MELSPQEFIFRSPLPDIPIPTHLPLYSYCFEKLSQFHDRPCLIDGDTSETLTYADVDLSARRISAGFHKMGIRQGDIIMLVLRNCPQFALAFLGATHRGAVVTTANPFYTPAELAKQATATKTRLVITQSAYVEKIKSFADDNDVMVMCIDDDYSSENDGVLHFSTLTNADETEAPAVKINPDDLVALPFSSGTSGLPKGVMLSHENLITTIAQLVDGENPHQYTHSEDVLLCVLPMFHIYALNSILLCGIRSGAAVLIVQKFEITTLFELIEKYKVTVASFVPPIVLALVKSGETHRYDLSSIRAVVTGAAPLGGELQEAIKARLPHATFGQGYGMTEAGPLAISMAFAKEPSKIKPGACGTVVRNAEMKIVDTETGDSLPRNKSGEICIRGAKVMKDPHQNGIITLHQISKFNSKWHNVKTLVRNWVIYTPRVAVQDGILKPEGVDIKKFPKQFGYLNDPEATERTIDREGWLHTGDIGFIDDDDELFIVDRLKELIKYKGFQVAPAELEALLIAHPNISDAAVVGMKDEAAGEIPVAFVVRSSGSEITEDEIKKYISQQVVFYKRIGRVFFTDSIPKAPSGKILRKVLTARLNEGLVVAN